MTYSLTSKNARQLSTSDLVIYNEIDKITRSIYAESLAGNLVATVDDGTIMTESTPTITVVGNNVGNGSVFTPGNTIIIAGTVVTFSNTPGAGTNLHQAVADINAANISGLVASTDGNSITLTYDPPQSSWSLAIADGTEPLSNLGLTAGSFSAINPSSVDYYEVWSNVTEDRKKSYELAQVMNHFQSLGYNILAKKNTSSDKPVIKWEIYW